MGMEYMPATEAVNPIAVKLVDAHSILKRKVSQATRACDAADAIDGITALQNPTLRLAAYAFGVSLAYVGAALRLSPEQREAVRNGWRPLILPRLASDVPALPSPQERFAGIVSELGGVAGALDELAVIERNGNGNGNGTIAPSVVAAE
jgi:hypothetical protein